MYIHTQTYSHTHIQTYTRVHMYFSIHIYISTLNVDQVFTAARFWASSHRHSGDGMLGYQNIQ